MKKLVLTIVGKDQSGLVESISKVLVAHQGHWLASNLSHLAGYFAGIVQVQVPDEQLTSLRETLAPIEHVRIEEDNSEESGKTDALNFVITGNDRPGIVNELSSIIKHQGANIIQFTSNQQSAPNWGVPLFNAVATVELPKEINKDVLVNALESLASDLIVDIEKVAD